jgi:hypothetical protein
MKRAYVLAAILSEVVADIDDVTLLQSRKGHTSVATRSLDPIRGECHGTCQKWTEAYGAVKGLQSREYEGAMDPPTPPEWHEAKVASEQAQNECSACWERVLGKEYWKENSVRVLGKECWKEEVPGNDVCWATSLEGTADGEGAAATPSIPPSGQCHDREMVGSWRAYRCHDLPLPQYCAHKEVARACCACP